MSKTRFSPKLAVMLGVMSASCSAILVRWAEAPSLVTAAYRMLWAAAILTPVVGVKNSRELKALSRRDILICAVSGLFLAAYFALWFESIKRATVAGSSSIVSTEVLFTALWFAVFLNGRIPRLGLAGIIAAFTGSVLIATGAGQFEGELSGYIFALVGAMCAAGNTVLGRLARERLSTGLYSCLTYLACAVVLTAFCLLANIPLTGWGEREVLIGLLLGIVCTVLGHTIFSWCLKYISPTYVASAKLCGPIFSGLMAAAIFNEMPHPLQVAGSLVVLGGMALYTYADTRDGAVM